MKKLSTEYQTIAKEKNILKRIYQQLTHFPDYYIRKRELNVFRHIIKKKRFIVDNSLIISSETRSGSTWLMEMLNNANGIVSNWEPLQPKYGVVSSSLNLGDRPYINDSKDERILKNEFRSILTLDKINFWTTSFIELLKLEQANLVLTKFVRTNLSLPWLTTVFDFKKKPILLLRHPITTSLSQINNFNLDKKFNTKYQVPICYNNTRYIENETYLSSLKTPVERKIAIWCINNIPTINHKNSNIKWKNVFYEDLMLNPKEEINKLKKFLDLDLNLDNIEFDKLSSSSKKSDMNRATHLEKWMEILSNEQKKRIQKIFDHYNLKLYNAYSAYPCK